MKEAIAQRASLPVATPESGWTFTDDRGVTVAMDRFPQRIAAGVFAAAPLWDFGIRPAGIFGWNINADGTLTAAGGHIDPMQVEILNGEPNMLDPEKAVAIEADLIVTVTFDPGDPLALWGMTPEAVPQVEGVAPVIAISGVQRADMIAERFADLAMSLGAAVTDPGITTQVTAYDAAAERLRQAVADRARVAALFAYPDVDQVYLGNPDAAADVQLFRALGLGIVPPEGPADDSWIPVSYEQIGSMQSDLFFYAVGEGLPDEDGIRAHPTLSLHPAVAAGRIAPWQQDVIFSYSGLATILDGVSEAVESLG
jgi:iron complex transport system substrate-binding protein